MSDVTVAQTGSSGPIVPAAGAGAPPFGWRFELSSALAILRRGDILLAFGVLGSSSS